MRAGKGFPCEVEFRLADLGRFFGREHHDSPSEWVATMVAEGLAERLLAKRGRGGYCALRMLDPYEVAEFGINRPEPQREFECFHEADVVPMPTLAQRNAQSDGVLALDPEKIADAAGGPLSALLDALRPHLGADRVEVWLEHSRLDLGASQLLLGNRGAYFYVNGPDGQAIRAAVRDAARALELTEDLAIGFDASIPPPAKSHSSAQFSAQSDGISPPSKQASLLAYRTPTKGSISKQASQPVSILDFWNEERLGPKPAIIAQAEALYNAIGDDSMLRGTAIHAVVLVDTGAMTQAEIDSLVVDRPCDFNVALKAAAGNHHLWIGRLRSLVRSRYGLPWKDRWDKPRTPRRAR